MPRWAAGNRGEYEQRPKTTTTTPSPPTHKNKTHKSLHLSTAIRLASPFPRMPQPLSHTGLWSVLCLYSSAFFVFSVSSSLLLEASICRCMHVCVCLHVRWGVCSLRWRLYPPGPEPPGPIRGCKYFMRYDSAAQTLLNHRPLTIFSGYVPFGKVRNNEINKHSLPPVTAQALWGLYAARLLMRGSARLPFLQEKENHWPIQWD